MASLQSQHHHTHLYTSACTDIAWLKTYTTLFNGTGCFIESDTVPYSVFLADACLIDGAAAEDMQMTGVMQIGILYIPSSGLTI